MYLSLILSMLLITSGCNSVQNIKLSGKGSSNDDSPQQKAEKEEQLAANGEPAYITVQHCLIAFQGSGTQEATRSQSEAEQLAKELFEKAKAGEDFDAMINQYTNDSPPGIYSMANIGVPPKQFDGRSAGPRTQMVPAFGDVGFKLAVGEYGLAEFNPRTSPYGWHIIKRIK